MNKQDFSCRRSCRPKNKKFRENRILKKLGRIWKEYLKEGVVNVIVRFILSTGISQHLDGFKFLYKPLTTNKRNVIADIVSLIIILKEAFLE